MSNVSAPTAPDGGNGNPQGHCSRCHRVWTPNERQGVCQWCGHLAICQSSPTKPRSIKSRSNGRLKQAPVHSNGYDQLDGEWFTYYKVASRFNRKAKAEDTEDLLHDIILTLAAAERNNGHKPFTEGTMYRIASRAVADYWRAYYKANNGLDCHTCSKAQRHKCKEGDLYSQCPKAIKLEYLNKPILDGQGNITELGELIADPESLDLDAWSNDTSLWEIGYKPRLVDIAYKLHSGEALTERDRQYLSRYRRQDQKKLF
ncbi:hypothetical protein ACFLTR_00175 [Chloroflexota bacterium]